MNISDALAYRCDCWLCGPQCEVIAALHYEIERLKIESERQRLLVRNYELSEKLDGIFTARDCDAAHPEAPLRRATNVRANLDPTA